MNNEYQLTDVSASSLAHSRCHSYILSNIFPLIITFLIQKIRKIKTIKEENENQSYLYYQEL